MDLPVLLYQSMKDMILAGTALSLGACYSDFRKDSCLHIVVLRLITT